LKQPKPTVVTRQTDVAVEFQRRTRLVWRSIRLWVVLLITLALGVTLRGVGAESDHFSLMHALIGMVILIACIYAISRAVERDYRCPACNEIPMGGSFGAGLDGGLSFDRDVLISPKVCPSCGARLK
jgi:hypothetical protein